jgi:hypothetical protein
MSILFTVVVSPRFNSSGTRSFGLYRSRQDAVAAMERGVRAYLEAEEEYDEEEIEEKLVGDDFIDTDTNYWCVSPVELDVGDIKTGNII